MPDSIFEPVEGGRFIATQAALGPWTNQALHGSPPTMLLARAIELFPADNAMFVSRLTMELLRPVGRTPLAVTSRLVRPGRKVQLVESSLWNGEQEVARATALRIRQSDIDVPRTTEPIPHPHPESVAPWARAWRAGDAYHTIGVEVRGPEPGGAVGPGWAWFRLKLPLLPKENPTPLIRICAAADFPNGISNVVDPRKTSYVNPDLSVFVIRPPVDEWVLVDARTWLEAGGTGMAEGALYDRDGRIGRSVQSLIVEPVTRDDGTGGRP
jgi:hypothetical protein